MTYSDRDKSPFATMIWRRLAKMAIRNFRSVMNSLLPPYFRVIGARHFQAVLVKRNERSLVRTCFLSVFRPSWVHAAIAHICGIGKENLALQEHL